MKKKKIVFIGIGILVLLFLLGALRSGKKNAVAETQISLTSVEVTPVKKGTVKDSHKFGGTVTAKDSVTVLPDTSGKVTEIFVREGDYVEKDGVIGKVDASRAGQTYNQSSVKSPISGTVTQVYANVGAMTAPSSPFAVVQTLDNLEISFSVIERYVAQIIEGNKATVTFDAFGDELFDAYISHVNPTVDVATRTLSAKAKLSVDDERVKAGMFARLSVITQVKDNVMVIPYSCVTVSADESYVFIVNDGKAVKTVVTTGIKDGNMIEITSGLNVGDMVISKGQGLVSDGQSVRVVN